MSVVKEGTEKERYSFSKLSAFHTCKYGYKLTYIDKMEGIGNCFSSYGLEIHSLMERYAKGELELEALPDVFQWEFDTLVTEKFPSSKYCKDMRSLYYEQGLSYLRNFVGYGDKKILDVESEFECDIDDWTLRGIIDLIFEDKDGRLILQDYKTKASFKNKAQQAEYARQLYLYSLYAARKHGRFPDILRFELVRKNNTIDIPFNKADLDGALNWAKETVNEIRKCWDYPPSCDKFFGDYLCNHREYCEAKN